MEMSRNDDSTTGHLLNYFYHQKYYKVLHIDLSKQTNTGTPQQIIFVRKLEEDDGTIMFFIAEKQQITILNFLLNSLIVVE